MGRYQLYCPYCNSYLEEYYTLDCLKHSVLIRTVYEAKQLHLQNFPGIWKYTDWLPVKSPLTIDSGPVTYQSQALAKELRMDSLYISFNGYWPEKGANAKSCTFKEYEALVTYPRVKETGYKGVYLASAGNTGRSFAYISQLTGIPTVVFVPEQNIDKFWLPEPNTDTITLISLKKGNDYTETCRLAARLVGLLSSGTGWAPEGGAKNVARRDGMASVLYDAVHTIKKIPHHYFQAIGSGTGGIATWEAALRFRADGRFGNYLPQLHLSQNLPYAPILNAWKLKSREIKPERDMPHADEKIKQVDAAMLTNRSPPYSIPGGVFDALTDTAGQMYGITNEELRHAEKLFLDFEGIDIVPEASVAVASLIKATEQDLVNKKEIILLNITGGGTERLKEDIDLHTMTPHLTVEHADVSLDEIMELLK